MGLVPAPPGCRWILVEGRRSAARQPGPQAQADDGQGLRSAPRRWVHLLSILREDGAGTRSTESPANRLYLGSAGDQTPVVTVGWWRTGKLTEAAMKQASWAFSCRVSASAASDSGVIVISGFKITSVNRPPV